jgi:hypothetical protein
MENPHHHAHTRHQCLRPPAEKLTDGVRFQIQRISGWVGAIEESYIKSSNLVASLTEFCRVLSRDTAEGTMAGNRFFALDREPLSLMNFSMIMITTLD